MAQSSGRRVLIMGVSGYVGRHLARRLARRSDLEVRGASRHRPPDLPGGVDFAPGDVTQPESLPRALEGVQVLVHAAAITGEVKEPYRGAYDEVNREGTANLVRAAEEAGVERIVLMSGLGCRPAPPGTYMATRWGMEEAVRRSSIPGVILQPSVLFGDRSAFFTALAGLIRVSPVVPMVGDGSLLLQPLWIEDLVTCLERSCAPEFAPGRALALGGSEQLTFKQVLQILCQAMHRRRAFAPIPLPLALIQARLLTAVLPRPPLTPPAVELFSYQNATDADAVEKSFGFRPRGFREHVLQLREPW